MGEIRLLLTFLLLMITAVLGWGFDNHWSTQVVDRESRWLIEIMGLRAYPLAQAMDLKVHALLGEWMAQTPGSTGEGLVIGLRMIFTRLGVLAVLSPLLLVLSGGYLYEARALRAKRWRGFAYTNPLFYRRIHHLPHVLLMSGICILLLPVPIHPLVICAVQMTTMAALNWRYGLMMKQ